MKILFSGHHFVINSLSLSNEEFKSDLGEKGVKNVKCRIIITL